MIIQGGTGNGYAVKVNNENMMLTLSVARTAIGHVSIDEGNSYSLPFSQISNGGANDCILYVKNLDSKSMVISQMWLSCTAADTIYAKYGMTGTAAGGATVVPINLNTNSAKMALGTFMTHTAVTGLSGGNIMFRSYFTANAISQRLYFDDAFILGQNGVWTLHVLTASANTVQGNLMFYYHE